MNHADFVRAAGATYEAAIADGEFEQDAREKEAYLLKLAAVDIEAKAIQNEEQRLRLEARERDEEEERRAIRKEKKKQKLITLGLTGAWCLLALVVLAGLTYGGYAVVTHNNRDYAGYGPNRVVAHAIDAFSFYYGENEVGNASDQFVTSTPIRSSIDGHSAWRTQVTDGKKIACTYVWRGQVGLQQEWITTHKILPGVCK